VKELPDVFTYGRTLKEARGRVREALEAWLDDHRAAQAADLVEHIRLPAGAEQALKAAQEVRKKAAELRAAAIAATRKAVARLAEAGLSPQDSGELLGLTSQGIHRLANAAPAPRESPGKRRSRS
jgi:predicted RNase H-like HicB family nuclease